MFPKLKYSVQNLKMFSEYQDSYLLSPTIFGFNVTHGNCTEKCSRMKKLHNRIKKFGLVNDEVYCSPSSDLTYNIMTFLKLYFTS